MAKGPSMLDQYAEITAEHPDTILFYRMGDFYEMFYDDAVTAAEVLVITPVSYPHLRAHETKANIVYRHML